MGIAPIGHYRDTRRGCHEACCMLQVPPAARPRNKPLLKDAGDNKTVHDNVLISPRRRTIAGAVLIILMLPSLGPVVSAQADSSMVVFGTRHAVALKNNGDVLTWGENVSCQLGRAAGNRSATPGQVLRNIKEVAAAAAHTLALDVDGKVYAWGGDAPTLGNNDDFERCEGPEPAASLADKTIAHIATGIDFRLAVTTGGDLYARERASRANVQR